MPVITSLVELSASIKEYLSNQHNKNIKRHELNFEIFENLNNNVSQYFIYLQLVSKIYFLYHNINFNDIFISKCFIKEILQSECLILEDYFKKKDFDIIMNVLWNLSDTKYIMVLSNLTFKILDNLIVPETLTRSIWSIDHSISIIITNSVFQIQSNTHLTEFDEQLIQLLSAVTKIHKTLELIESYTFWFCKIDKLMFAVLIPRYSHQNNSLINIWPIVPVSSFFDSKKVINNLKISEMDKSIFHSIASFVKQGHELKILNLRKEMTKGVTLPMLIQNRITVNCLYIAFFYEFLQENEHFRHDPSVNEYLIYLRCVHCKVIFSDIFEFVRHWWIIDYNLIFRCHLCHEKTNRLSKLGLHYRQSHYNYIQKQTDKISNVSLKGLFKISTKIHQHKDINIIPESRKCAFCDICKDGLHSLRIHLRDNHMQEILNGILLRIQNDFKLQDGFLDPSQQRPDLNFKVTPMIYSHERFCTLFTYNITCPLCKDTTYRFLDSITLLSHIAKSHSSLISFKELLCKDKCEELKNEKDDISVLSKEKDEVICKDSSSTITTCNDFSTSYSLIALKNLDNFSYNKTIPLNASFIRKLNFTHTSETQSSKSMGITLKAFHREQGDIY